MRSAVLLLLLAAAAPAAAQPCTGDCNGDGVVRVEEMIVGVRLALGETGDCPAFDVNDDGTVGIEELVRAVGNLLNGCPATPVPTATETPSPSPTSTDTATPTESATAAATPTIPPVAGAWVEAPLTVGESTCAEQLTEAFADQLEGRGPCSQEVEMTGETSVRVTDCSEQVVDGTLDRDGTMHLVFPPSDSTVGGCTVTLSTSSAIAAGADPVTADYTFGLVFGGETCPLENCTINAAATWTRDE
jgi:hypothetical protein